VTREGTGCLRSTQETAGSTKQIRHARFGKIPHVSVDDDEQGIWRRAWIEFATLIAGAAAAELSPASHRLSNQRRMQLALNQDVLPITELGVITSCIIEEEIVC